VIGRKARPILFHHSVCLEARKEGAALRKCQLEESLGTYRMQSFSEAILSCKGPTDFLTRMHGVLSQQAIKKKSFTFGDALAG
jgi:hypothetical protein